MIMSYAPLHEGGVDREKRLKALRGKAGCEERRVLLGDTDIVILSGCDFAKCTSPVPVGIAPVIATILLLVSANFARVFPKISE
jgi:hypothetical protein